MSEKEKIVPNPEGYTIVKYLEVVVVFCFIIGMILSIPLFQRFKEDKGLANLFLWGGGLLFGLIGHGFTEVRVLLRITEMGLEQTRLSGSVFCPKYRLIEWKNMSKYYLNPRWMSKGIDFLVLVNSDNNFRISMPWIRIFEKQKNNQENLDAFKEEFFKMASKHNVSRDIFDS